MANGATLLLIPTELESRRIDELGGVAPGFGERAICGFGPVAAAARASQLLGRHRPRRVVLLGIAGAFDLERHPLGSALGFTRVALDGVGVGAGADFQGPSALGFPQWPGSADQPGLGEVLPLALPPAGPSAELLLTTCAASGSPAEARERRERFPGAAAEDMEGFGVALACALHGVPLSVVRGIANRVGERDGWRIRAALAAARRLLFEAFAPAGAQEGP